MMTALDLNKIFASVPSIDLAALYDCQQRNIEAMRAAGSVMAEGTQAIIKRQSELATAIAQEAMDAGVTAMKSAIAGKPVDIDLQKIQQNLAAAQANAEKTIADTRALAEMATKNGAEVMDILRQRTDEGIKELKQLIKAA